METAATSVATGVEYLGVPFYDDDVWKMLVRFGINILFLTLIVKAVYLRSSRSKDYVFTYAMLNVLVFFICFTLKKLELELGMALGLFAIFGVMRYRTDAIPIREMSYLFIVIGVAAINALANRKVSWLELAFTNLTVVSLAAFLESLSFFKQEGSENILYEKIDLIRPDKHDELIADLQERTGLVISRIELGQVNLLQDTVAITAYYYPHEQPQQRPGDIAVTRRQRRK